MVERIVEAFEQGIIGEQLLEFLVQFKRGQLQQTDRLLQLRGQRKVLGCP